MKNMKMWVKISSAIAILLVIGLVIILVVTSSTTKSNVTDITKNRMMELSDARSYAFETYCDNYIRYVKGFASLDVVKNVLENPDDASAVSAAQKDIEAYAANNESLEGLLICDLDSLVLNHINTSAIGSIMYSGDTLSVLETITEGVKASDDGVYVRGVTASKSTGELVFCAYVGVFDDSGELIGFVTGGYYVSYPREDIYNMSVYGLDNSKVDVINLSTNTYVMCDDEALLNTEVTDESLLAAESASESSDEGTLENVKNESGTTCFLAYDKILSYNLLVVVSNPESDVMAPITSMIIKLSFLIVVILVVLLAATIIISRAVASGFTNVSGKVKKIADSLDMTLAGDLKPFANRKDEVGDVAKATVALTDAVTDAVRALQAHGKELFETSENLADISNQTLQNVNQVESAVQDIADGATSQANETEKATSSVVEIGGQIQDASSVASSIMATSEKMNQASRNVSEVIDKLTGIGEQTAKAIDKIYEQTNTTNASATKIKQATEIITSIAEETNLLSLNASIEAARAGEQGKGFAVVASQIQKLAEQSSDSARQIDAVIATLIEDSDEAVRTMADVKEVMQQQTEYVQETGDIFDEVRTTCPLPAIPARSPKWTAPVRRLWMW